MAWQTEQLIANRPSPQDTEYAVAKYIKIIAMLIKTTILFDIYKLGCIQYSRLWKQITSLLSSTLSWPFWKIHFPLLFTPNLTKNPVQSISDLQIAWHSRQAALREQVRSGLHRGLQGLSSQDRRGPRCHPQGDHGRGHFGQALS